MFSLIYVRFLLVQFLHLCRTFSFSDLLSAFIIACYFLPIHIYFFLLHKLNTLIPCLHSVVHFLYLFPLFLPELIPSCLFITFGRGESHSCHAFHHLHHFSLFIRLSLAIDVYICVHLSIHQFNISFHLLLQHSFSLSIILLIHRSVLSHVRFIVCFFSNI